MKKLLSIILLSLISCGTTKQAVEPIKEVYEDVELNKSYKVDIGQPLVTTGVLKYLPAIKINTLKPFKFRMKPFPYGENDILPLIFEDNNRDYYGLKDERYATFKGISITKRDSIIQAFEYVLDGLNTTNFTYVEDFTFDYTKTPDADCSDCFKQEFVYNGKNGNNLKFLYREYVNNMMRASFNQEINYNLDEGNIVGFKGLRIEVIETSNTSITYKVIKGFD